MKQSLQEKDNVDDKGAKTRFSCDWTGLEFLNKFQFSPVVTPKFYGGDILRRIILIEDLGDDHYSLVDALTTPGYDKAVASLKNYMETLGHFHSSTFGKTHEYHDLIRKIDGIKTSWSEDYNEIYNELIQNLQQSCQVLNIDILDNVYSEIYEVLKNLFQPSDFTVLIHGDLCPDNTFIS